MNKLFGLIGLLILVLASFALAGNYRYGMMEGDGKFDPIDSQGNTSYGMMANGQFYPLNGGYSMMGKYSGYGYGMMGGSWGYVMYSFYILFCLAILVLIIALIYWVIKSANRKK